MYVLLVSLVYETLYPLWIWHSIVYINKMVDLLQQVFVFCSMLKLIYCWDVKGRKSKGKNGGCVSVKIGWMNDIWLMFTYMNSRTFYAVDTLDIAIQLTRHHDEMGIKL